MTKITITNDQEETITIKLGDIVGFKSDIEQYGKVTEIKNRSFYDNTIMLVLESDGGFDGHYIGGDKTYTTKATAVWST